MELLAPAGNSESLHAAVSCGADAVYFGGALFNARRYANNFGGDGMREAIDFCHVHGVKAYITLNTLILDREMNEALEYAALLNSYGADAVLVQDLGLLKLIRSQIPKLTVHASTQMAIHDLAGVRACEGLGIERVVLARELSLENIAYIHERSNMELEVFVHGALCMSASGNCLFSSMVGERSGNRGTCAQPCRKRISVNGLPGEKDYHLSLSDLCMLEHIKELRASGVCSLKIEGRMKSPDYVAAAVRAYRAALDGKAYKEYGEQLLSVFNRGGVHTGYFFGDDTHTGCVAVSSDKLIYAAVEEEKVSVNMKLSLNMGSPAALELKCRDEYVKVTGEEPQAAIKAPELSRYKEQLEKLGNTPYYAESCEIDSDGGSYMSIRDINELRRLACEGITEKLSPKRQLASIYLPEKERKKNEADAIRIIASVQKPELIKAALDAGAKYVAYEPWNYTDVDTEGIKGFKERLLLLLPASILSVRERENVRELLASDCFCGGIANHFSQLELLKALPERIAGISCNAYNSYTVEMLKDIGFNDVLLSLELTKAQIRDILLSSGASLYTYGRIPLMQLRHCPQKEYNGCRRCHGDAGTLTDEAGREFPLRNTAQDGSCLIRVLNCETLDIVDVAASVSGCRSWLLSFCEEDAAQMGERINAARRAYRGERVERKGGTRGHWNRPLI